MSSVQLLDFWVPASAETQTLALRRARYILRQACGQSHPRRPGSEQLHGFRYARQVGRDFTLEAVDLALPPALHRCGRKPSDPNEHVEGAHIVLGGECR